MNLFSEFKESSQEEWEQKIIQDLKGKPFETVIWQSELGSVNPVLFSTEIEQENPAQFPYTRGNKVFNNSWDIRQEFDASDNDINQQLLKALAGGVNALELYNLPEDVDFNAVFDAIQIDIIKVYLRIGDKEAVRIIEKYVSFLESKGYDLNTIYGGFLFDPIRELALSGVLNFQEETVLALQAVKSKIPHFVTFGIDGSIYADAGADITTQIACVLSHGHEYLVQRLNAGEDLLTILHSMEFTFSIGTSYFMEIAKIRAFRTLWSTIVNEYDENIEEFEIKINAKTSNLYYSLKDKYNNLLRATTSGMSAVIAGVNSLVVLPFDNNEEKESADFGLRLAKNIQLLLQEESYMGQVADVGGGSYYIEELTRKIEDKAWNEFKELEQNGGVVEELIQGAVQDKINQQYDKKVKALKEEKRIMVGVNKFQNKEEKIGNPIPLKEPQNTLIQPLTMKRLAMEFE